MCDCRSPWVLILHWFDLFQVSLNDSHNQMVVHWAGEKSNVIVALARDSLALARPRSSDVSINVVLSMRLCHQHGLLGSTGVIKSGGKEGNWRMDGMNYRTGRRIWKITYMPYLPNAKWWSALQRAMRCVMTLVK